MRNNVVIKRGTDYIEFISGIATNATKQGERCSVFKKETNWVLVNESKQFFELPTTMLRIFLNSRQGDFLIMRQDNIIMLDKTFKKPKK